MRTVRAGRSGAALVAAGRRVGRRFPAEHAAPAVVVGAARVPRAISASNGRAGRACAPAGAPDRRAGWMRGELLARGRASRLRTADFMHARSSGRRPRVGTGNGWRSLPPWASEKRAGSVNRQGAPCTTSATIASARTVRAPTPGTSSRSAKSRGPRSAAAASAPCRRRVDDVLGPDVVMLGHDQMRQQRLRGSARGAAVGRARARGQLAHDAVGPEVGEQIELAVARRPRRGGRSRLTMSPWPRALDRRVRRVDEARQPLREPVIAARLPAVAVHALLHDDPAPVVGDDEAVQIEVEAVLHGGAVDLGDQPARPRERRAVEADALADGDQFAPASRGCACRGRRRRAGRARRRAARGRASARRCTLVVMPDECQSMPITAPNDWNQNGCASRRSNSSRPYSSTMASAITAPSRVMRWPSQAGTRPPCSGRSALPARRAISVRPCDAVARDWRTARPVGRGGRCDGWGGGAGRVASRAA